jgi:predicted RNA-binding Zn-ribbon protein involved in translation (DUF1610 family)
MGETKIGPVVCTDCGQVLDVAPNAAERAPDPCPQCGSSKRTVNVAASGEARGRADLDMKATRPKPTGGKRLLRHIKTGMEFFRKTGEWHERNRDLDFENNRYREHIVNESGDVVRSVDEALTDHQNRGTAKPKPPTP